MPPSQALLDHAVGEACAHVQGESLKAHAALLRRLINSPITRMGDGPMATASVGKSTLKWICGVSFAFVVVFQLLDFVVGGTDNSNSKSAQDDEASVTLGFEAVSCGLISAEQANALLMRARHNAVIDSQQAGTDPQVATDRLDKKKNDGISYAQTVGCGFWRSHPDMVTFIQSEATVAQLAIAELNYDANKSKGKTIDKLGSIFDAFVCDQPDQVDFEFRPGCRHLDNVPVFIVSLDRDILQLRWNGFTKYAFAQRAVIKCHGADVSITSYLGGDFPPGVKC